MHNEHQVSLFRNGRNQAIRIPHEFELEGSEAIIHKVRRQARGLPIGYHDLLIAAHALSLGLTVVTANEREFSRIENLTVENWI